MNGLKKKICSVDIDGILNYYPECWVEFMNKELGMNFRNKEEAKQKLSKEEYRKIKDKYRKSDFKADLKIREEAAELLRFLKRKKYDIIIVTMRPFEHYPLLKKTTERWLEKNNIPYDQIERKTKDFFKKYPNLSFHIDDEIDDIKELVKANYTIFLFNKQKDNEIIYPNIKEINDIKDIMSHINEH